MSLINDALKKAQKQRTGDSLPLAEMPGVGGESAARIAKRDKPAGFNAQLLRLAIGAGGLLALVVVGAIVIFRITRHPAAAKPVETVTAPAKPVPPPTTPVPKEATPAINFTLPVAPVSHEPAPAAVTSITASAGSEIVSVPSPAEATVTPEPVPRRNAEPAAPKTPPEPVKLDAKAVNFIENLRIAGIRASPTDSKVLMNDHVYRIGDIVEHDLGLKLTGITSSSLSFEDERGGRYTRNF